MKDSFVTLKLLDFLVLFEASRLHFFVPIESSQRTTSPVPDPSFLFLSGPGLSAIAHRGLSRRVSEFHREEWCGGGFGLVPGPADGGLRAQDATLARDAEPRGPLQVWLPTRSACSCSAQL